MVNHYPIRFAAQLRQHLKAFRKARKLTQAQLGSLIGVSQARIAEIEANPGLVKFEQLMQLLSALGVTVTLNEDLSTWQAPAVAASTKRPSWNVPATPYLPVQESVWKGVAGGNVLPRHSVDFSIASWGRARPGAEQVPAKFVVLSGADGIGSDTAQPPKRTVSSSLDAQPVASAGSGAPTTLKRKVVGRSKKGTW